MAHENYKSNVFTGHTHLSMPFAVPLPSLDVKIGKVRQVIKSISVHTRHYALHCNLPRAQG